MVRFLAPAALWLLLSLPVIVLLHMLRARRISLIVSSTLLWERTARELIVRLPVRRLERSLLLVLQLLAAAVLALALARPAVVWPGRSGALVLVFDTSLSMQARDAAPGGLTRLAAAGAEALALVERSGRGIPVMIIAAGSVPRTVLEFSTEPAAIRRAVRRLVPTDAAADLEGAVRAAASVRLRGRPAQVVVFTDGAGPALPRVAYRLYGGSSANLAITRAAASRSEDRPLLLVEVTNFGEAARRATLRVAWPDGTAETAAVEIAGGRAASRVWAARGEGIADISILGGDILPGDDRVAVPIGTAALPRVLLVTPGNPFLESALSVLPSQRVEVTSTGRAEAWGDYDLIVLDRVTAPVLPPGRYLLIGTFPDALPVEVGDPVTGPTVLRTAAAHPLLRMVDLSGIRVEEAPVLRPRAGQVLAEGSVPLLWVLDRPDLRVVLLPFDLTRSDLPLHPAFPLLMANALEWLAPPTVVTAGTAPVLPAPTAARVDLVDPAGGQTAVAPRDGVLVLPLLERAGQYLLRAGDQTRRIIVTPATATESDLRRRPAAPGPAPAELGLQERELWALLVGLALLLLLAEGALWLRAHPGRVPRTGTRGRRPVPVLRLAVTGMLLLALAGLEIARGGRDLAVVFALDLSDSVSVAERQRAADLMAAAVAAGRTGDRFGLVTFGADALVAEGLTAPPRLSPAARPAAHRTDIGRAIRTALGVLPAGGTRRIIVLTDGHDTEGDAVDAAVLAAVQGVEVGVVPLGGPPGPESRVDVVQAPETVAAGERFEIRVWTEATAPASGTLRLLAAGREVWRGPLQVQAGRTLARIPQQAAAPGTLIYEARLEVSPDRIPDNNRGVAVVRVVGPPTVLYVARAPGPLVTWLRGQGLAVRSIDPAALPADAAQLAGVPAIILDDVPATVLSPAQMQALREYAAALGGGLVVVGGPHAFGVGGYAGTDLEAALPVSMDVRHRVAIPSVAVMLVIDASGSMGSFGGEIAKVELAKEAAQSVIDLLAERDLIGVIAFDQDPHWLVRPTEARQRERILTQVSRITAGGGTNLYPALREAHRALTQAQAKVRHVIILSDGQTDPGDFERLVRRMARDGITLSSIAIGSDADQEIMRDLAGWGRGRYYFTRDLYSIPQIVTAEAVLATRAYLIEERFRPLVSPVSALLRDLQLPALRGYVATVAKPSATLHALTPQEDPLLATWQFGLGRALVFTSDARARWAAEWMGWPDAARLWSRLIRWTITAPADRLDVQAEVRGDRVRVVLDARDARGELLTDVAARAQVVGTDQAVDLAQSRPGVYEGTLALAEPGGYLVMVSAERNGRPVGTGSAAVVLPYSPELAAVGAAPAAIARMVEAAGARVLTSPAEMVAPLPGGQRRVPAWPPLTVAALGLFLAEITLRRLPVIREVAGRLGAAVVGWLRHTPPPAPEDREYETADQWRPTPGELEASADMEQAARLYIARLRQEQEGSERARDRRPKE